MSISEVYPLWTEEQLVSMTSVGDSTRCFIAIFENQRCISPGGIYQIRSSWYFNHVSAAIREKCGGVAEFWINKGRHSMYRTELRAGKDFPGRATIVATLHCGNLTAPTPAPATTEAPEPEPEVEPEEEPEPESESESEVGGPGSEIAAADFLIQSSFGPTRTSVQEVASAGFQ